MPRTFPMSTLVRRCQQRADREGDGHINDTAVTSEWRSLISEQFGELYLIVADSGLRYFETTDTITATGAAYYAEPADHLGTVLMTRVLDASGARYDLEEVMVPEQSHWSGMTGDALEFTLIDDRIYLFPTPGSGTYELRYIQQPPDLTTYADGDLVDVVSPAGEAFLIWGVAVKALSKSESDVSLAIAERDRFGAMLAEWASLRAYNGSRRRVVVRSNTDYADPLNDPGGYWIRGK